MIDHLSARVDELDERIAYSPCVPATGDAIIAPRFRFHHTSEVAMSKKSWIITGLAAASVAAVMYAVGTLNSGYAEFASGAANQWGLNDRVTLWSAMAVPLVLAVAWGAFGISRLMSEDRASRRKTRGGLLTIACLWAALMLPAPASAQFTCIRYRTDYAAYIIHAITGILLTEEYDCTEEEHCTTCGGAWSGGACVF